MLRRLLLRRFFFKSLTALLITGLLICPVLSQVNDAERLSKNSQTNESKEKAAPILVVLTIGAAIGGTVKGVEYTVETLVFGGGRSAWDWYDFSGQVTSGALFGMAEAITWLFPVGIIAKVFSITGSVTTGVLASKLGDILGDLYKDAVAGIQSWCDAIKFSNVKTTVVDATSGEVESLMSDKVNELINESGTSPTPPDSIEMWAGFQSEIVESRNMAILTQGMEFNSHDGYSWRMLNPGSSYLQSTFELDTLPDKVLLELTHLSSYTEGVPGNGYSPVDIIINGNIVEDNYDVAENHGHVHSYATDIWQIEDFLHTGSNILQIEFEDNPWAYTPYWVQNIAVRFAEYQASPPTVLATNYSDCISYEDWDTIYVEVKNEDGLATDGGVTISFPCLRGINDSQYVELLDCSSDTACGYREYPQNSWIHDRNGNLMQADYLMVEIADNHIEHNETMYLRIRVQPQSVGNFDFYVRCAMGYDGVYYNDPDDIRGEVSDQQGWEVFRNRIRVSSPSYDAVNVDHLVIDDDYGNGNGVPESGEDLKLDVYLKNKTSQTITNVDVYLSTSNPNVTIDQSYISYPDMNSNEVKRGEYSKFRFHTLTSFSGSVNFNLKVTFCKGSDVFYDTDVIPITIYAPGSNPYFSINSMAFYDTSGGHCDSDGVPESGEMGIHFTVELLNSGGGPGVHITGIIDTFKINGQWLIPPGQVEYYPDIPPGESRNPNGHFFIDGIPSDFAGVCTLNMHVVYGSDEADTQHINPLLNVEPTPYLWVTPNNYDFGLVEPGDTVRKVFQINNGGTANLVIDSINTDSVDTQVEGISFPLTVLPGNRDSFIVVINTEGLNACITRNIMIFSNDHDTNMVNICITGTVTPPASAEYKLLWSSASINHPCCIEEADTDNDGNPELIVGTVGSGTTKVHIYEKLSDDNYQEVWVSPADAIDGRINDNLGMTMGDIDKNGKEEIIVATYGSTVDPKIYIFKNNGDDSCYLWYSGLGGNGKIMCVTCADADGDGKNEIIYGTDQYPGPEGGRVYVYENNGGTSFSKVWESPVLGDETGIAGLAIDDVDGDGKNEVVVTTYDDETTEHAELYIFETTGDNSFSQTFYTELDWGSSMWEIYDISIYDIDGDGAKEIAIGSADEYKIYVFETTGDNTYEKIWETPDFHYYPLTLATGDTDLDGKGEFIIGDEIGKLRIFETFADNSYIQIWCDSTSLADVLDICLANTNSTPEPEIVVVDYGGRFHVFGFLKQPNLTVASNNIQFSNLTPEEGVTDTIYALIRNIGTAQASPVVVRIFDGNPDSGGVQIGSDIQIDSLDINESSQIETEWSPTLADTHYIYVVVDPDSIIDELDETDNTAFAKIYVFDDDEDPPAILNITANEHLGDSDDWLEDDEELKISWTLQDISGIDTTFCKVDTLELPVSGGYYAIGGPFTYGEHQLIITAVDADNTPEESADTSFFFVYYHAPSVDSVFPANGDTSAFEYSIITATFNEDMDNSSINESTFVLQDSTGTNISGYVTYISNTRTARFVPDSSLINCMIYTATLVGDSSKNAKILKSKIDHRHQLLLSTEKDIVLGNKGGIRDEHGNYLDSNYVWSFKVTSDTIPPTMPILITPSDSSWLSNAVVYFRWSPSSKKNKGDKQNFRRIEWQMNEKGNIKASPVKYIFQIDTTNLFSTSILVDTTEINADTLTLDEDEYYWRVRTFDLAGNESDFSNPFWFVVDTTAPVIDSTTILADTVHFLGPFEIKTKIIDNVSFSNPRMFYRTSIDTMWVVDTMTFIGEGWYLDSIPEQPPANFRIDYYLTVKDFANNGSRDPDSGYYFSFIVGIEEKERIPKDFVLFSPSPNPSIRDIVIKYGLPEQVNISLRLYDISGRLVKTIYSGAQEKGYHKVDIECRELAKGIYFIKFQAGDFKVTKKLVIMQ